MKHTESADRLRMIEVSALRDISVAALSNPICTLVGGVIIVSAAQKAGLVDADWAQALQGGVFGVATMQALSPIVKDSGMSDALLALGAGILTGGAAETGLAAGSLKALEAANPRGKGSFWKKLEALLFGIP